MTKTLPNKTVDVKEFARLAGVSSQAVYKQLPTKLATYSTKVGNRWFIDISALEEVYHKDKLQTKPTKVGNQNQPVSDINQELIQLLKDQLAAKDKQIAELQKNLDQEQHLRMAEIQNHQAALEELQKQLQAPKKQKGGWWFRKSSE